MSVGISICPVFSYSQNFRGVSGPQFQICSYGKADSFHRGPQVPRFADAETVNSAALQVHDHLGWRDIFQHHIAIGVNATGSQPVAQQQVVHRRRVNDAQAVSLSGGSTQHFFEICQIVDSLVVEALREGNSVTVAAHGEGCNGWNRLLLVAS